MIVQARLGGQRVTIYAPALDDDTQLPAFRRAFPAGVKQLIGLDVECTYMDGAGQWSKSWECRTIQLAGDDRTAWVMRCDDFDQMCEVQAVLADPAKSFTSHTQTDPHAILVALGVDIMGRYVDTHPLSVMNAPDDRKGQADLKSVSTRFGMPELAEADQELTGEPCARPCEKDHTHARVKACARTCTTAHTHIPSCPKDCAEDHEHARSSVCAKGCRVNHEHVRSTVFDDLYRVAHPEIGHRAVAKTDREAFGFDTVPVDEPTFVKYAGLDAIAVRRVSRLTVQELGSRRTPHHLLATEVWLSEQVTRQKARGLLVDTGRLHAMQTATREAVEATTADLEAICGLRPSQNAKLIAWFGDHIDGGWPDDHPRTESGAPSLGDKAYHRLRRYGLDADATKALEVYSRFIEVSNQHTLSTQVAAALDPHDRIHPTIYSVGTITSRMSSAGPNIQNWAKPKDLSDPARAQRELILFDEGEVGISCDFNQIEYRVAAALSGEPVLIETIRSGGDLHQLTADRIGITRQHAKTVNFAVLYGTGGAKLAKIMNYAITENEGREIVAAYWDAYPRLKALRDEMMGRDGVRLYSGRWVPVGRITKGDRAGTETVWALLNYLIQGNCRELLVGAWSTFAGLHPDYASFVRFPVHDELIVSCPRDRAEEVSKALVAAMSFDFLGVPTVPLDAEADILLDEDGVSRWMSGDIAKKIRLAKEERLSK